MLRLNLRSKLLLCNVLSSYEQLLSQFLLFSGLLTSPKSANLKFLNSEITISFPVPKIRFMRNWKSKELFKGVLSVVKILRILSKYIHFFCDTWQSFRWNKMYFQLRKIWIFLKIKIFLNVEGAYLVGFFFTKLFIMLLVQFTLQLLLA